MADQPIPITYISDPDQIRVMLLASGQAVHAPLSALDVVYRRKLTGALTLYVRSDGSDSNNGKANTASGAVLTIQKAVDIAKAYDSVGYTITISVSDATRTVGATVNGPLVGGGSLNITGNTTTPANCVINATSANGFFYTNGAVGTVRGFKVTTTTSGDCLGADLGSYLTYGNMNFGACAGMHVNIGTGANCFAAFNYTISGGATGHFHTGSPCVLFCNAITITITGTPAFSAYFAGAAGGYQILGNITFSGAATGKRFLAHKNGVIDVGTTSFTFLPGNVAGTTESGGKYVGDLTSPDIIGALGSTDGVMVVADGTGGVTVKAHASGAPGTAAFKNTGTSGNTVPLLDGVNTWSGIQTFSANPSVTGGAITFPATQVLSAGANDLDDYEEGTFTPAFAATGATFAYTSQTGIYTKIGRLVEFDISLVLNTVGNTLTANALTITGLPFTSAAGSGVFPVRWGGSTTSYVLVTGRTSGTTVVLEGLTAAATGTTTIVANGLLTAGVASTVRIIGVYHV